CRAAAHPGGRHRRDQPRGAADRLAAAARHLAGRHPRGPDRPHPPAPHRGRVGPPLPRPALPHRRHPPPAGPRPAPPIRPRPPAAPPPPSPPETAFLPPSGRAPRRTVRRRQRLIALLTALVLGFAAATVVAIRAGQQVTHRLNVVTSGQLSSQSRLIGDTLPA